MKRLAVVVLVAVLVIGLAMPAFAGGRRHRHYRSDGATTALLVLTSFTALASMANLAYARPVVYEREVYVSTPTRVIYSPAPQVLYVEPAPTLASVTASVVSYPHGRYELRQYGAHYQWVWIPNPPAPPVAPAVSCIPTGKYVKTAEGLVPECQ